MTETRTRLRPRDDRAWPAWAVPFSALVVLAAVATFAVVLVIAAGTTRLFAVLAFVAVAAVEGPICLAAMGRFLEGRQAPWWSHLAQLGLLAAAFVAAGVTREVGVAMFAGLFGAMFVANLWSIRAARSNRARVDEVEAELARDREELAREEPPVREYADRDMPVVGTVLRETRALALRRWMAWLVAGALTLTGCVLLDAPEAAFVGVVFIGGGALLWVARRLVGTWLALRDFSHARTEPRRAYVVLLHDPTPRMVRPLLGVWTQEPVAGVGRLPKPERVFRCDDELDALESYQGSVVVHEAWVDTGSRTWSKPRWVAADSGVALPHRRALLGRWFMSSLIGGERPEPALRLTMPAPRPDAETITDLSPRLGSFPVKVAWRLAGLTAAALAFALLV